MKLHLKIKIGFIALNLCGAVAPSASWAACSLARNGSSPTLVPSTIVASFTKNLWDYAESNIDLNIIPITGCTGVESLQISKIGLNYNPEDYRPQIYDSSKMHNFPVSCDIESDVNKIWNKTEHAEQYSKISNYVNQCIGVEIDSSSGAPIIPLEKTGCEFDFINQQKTKIIVKGENCQILKARGDYIVAPVYLDGCSKSGMAQSGLGNIESSMTVFSVDKQANVLASKNVQLAINADLSQTLPVARTVFQSRKLEMLRPTDYSIDLDFADLTLKRISNKVIASAKYFIQNKSECKNEICLGAAAYRSPMVIENDLYLVRANNLSERIYLGRWYNASVVPAQWSGLDGVPMTNAIVYNWNSIALNSSFASARQGDSLVLVSHLLNPNRGIANYVAAGFEFLKQQNPQSRNSLRTDNFGEGANGFGAIGRIGSIAALEPLKFKNLLNQLDFNSVINSKTSKTDDRSNLWLIRYQRYCSQDSSECTDIKNLTEFVTIETEIKITKLDEVNLELKPVETLKYSSLNKNSYDLKMSGPTKIKCLKTEISNNDIRSKK